MVDGVNKMDPSTWNPTWVGAGNASGGRKVYGDKGLDHVYEQFTDASGRVHNHTVAEYIAEQCLTPEQFEQVSEEVKRGGDVSGAILKVTGKSPKQITKERDRAIVDWAGQADEGLMPDWAKKSYFFGQKPENWQG